MMKKILTKIFTALFLLSINSVQATIFTVTNTNNAGLGSLRDAIIKSNSDLSATSIAPHIIDASGIGIVLNISTALPTIQNHIQINGPSNSLLTIRRKSGTSFRIFNILNTNFSTLELTVTLSNLSIRNGEGAGGGVRLDDATVTINNCEIDSNKSASSIASGIYSESSTLFVNSSIISNNTNIGGLGGGVYVSGTGSATFTNCTFAKNSALIGGAIDVASAAKVKLNNCTVAENFATSIGGGIYVSINSVELNNTIVARNKTILSTSGADIYKEITFTSGGAQGVSSTNGHNLIGDINGFLFVTGTNQTGNIAPPSSLAYVCDSVLNYNGGLTQTFSLTACSPAVDAGTNTGATAKDQRDSARINVTDIGAFEYYAIQVANDSSCGPAIFTVPVKGGNSPSPFYNWYTVPVGDSPFASGTPFITSQLNVTDTFYVEEAVTCPSLKRYRVILKVNPFPAIPVITATGYSAGTKAISVCDDVAIALTHSVDTKAKSYLWLPTNETTNAINVTKSNKGNANYKVEITDIFGCKSLSDSINISFIAHPATPTISITNGSGSATVCESEIVHLHANTSTTPITNYLWSLEGTRLKLKYPSNADTLVDYNFAKDTGSYTVSVYSTIGCSTTSGVLKIKHNPLPLKTKLTVTGVTTFCVGDSVLLANSDLINNTIWTPTSKTTSSIYAKTAGDYFAMVTDAKGCKNFSDTVKVVVNTPVKPTITNLNNHPLTFCDGDSVTLTSSSSNAYLWSNGATTKSITVKVNTQNLKVSTTDANGCKATSDSININVIPLTIPVVSVVGKTSFCAGDSVKLTSNQPNNTWFPTGEKTTSIVVKTSGKYYTTIPGCSDTSNVVDVKVNTPVVPIITATDSTTFCAGDSVILLSSLKGGNVWSTGETTDSIKVFSTKLITVTTTDNNGCVATSLPLQITAKTPVQAVIQLTGPNQFCQGDSVQLNSSIASGNQWLVDGVVKPSLTTQAIYAKVSGTYSVTISGCSIPSVGVAITVHTLPTKPKITVSGATTFCVGDSVLLSNSDLSNATLWNPNLKTTPSIYAKTSGNYFARITDAFGCKNYSDTIKITVNIPTKPIITIKNNHATTFCDGDSVTLISSSSAAYLWSNGATQKTIVIKSSALKLNVTTTDINGCKATSDSVSVTVIPLITPVVSISGSTTFCEGDSVILTSDQSNNTWQPTKETSKFITVKATGNYYATIPGCSDTSNVVSVNVKKAIIPTITAKGATTFCAGDSVILVSSAIGGNVWSTGETTDSIKVVTTNLVTLTTTDLTGCTGTSNPIQITVNQIAQPIIQSVGSNEFCEGDSIQLNSTATTGNIWSKDGVVQTSLTAQTVFVKAAGTYSVQVGGCSLASPGLIIISHPIPVKPSIILNGTNNVCGGDSVNLLASYNKGIQWSNGLTAQSIYVKVSGLYTVIFTDAFGCTATSNPFQANINPLPTNPIITSKNGLNVFCQGDSLQLTSSYLQGNTWSTGQTTQSIFVKVGGSYSVTALDAKGCSATSQPFVVSEVSSVKPTISLLGNDTICEGDNVTLTSSSVNGNLWNTGETTQSITVTKSGSYSVLLQGCSLQSNTIKIVVNKLPVAPILTPLGPITICSGDSAKLTSSVASIQWSTLDTAQTIYAKNTGNYFALVTDVNGCTNTSNAIQVNVMNKPFINLGKDQNQCGGLVTLNAGNVGSTYLWNTPTKDTTQTIKVGTGSYSVIVTNSCGVDTSNIVNIVINSLPIVNLGNDTSQCTGIIALDAGNSGMSYLWSDGSKNKILVVSTTGTYSVEVTDAKGCSASDSINVSINSIAPNIILGKDITQCEGIVTLDAGNIGVSYNWNLIGNPISLGTNKTLAVISSGIYVATVTNACGSNSDTIEVTINKNPIVDLGNDTTQCKGTIALNAQNLGATFLWNNSSTTQQIQASKSGTYSVIVKNSNGCVATDSIVVTLNDTVPFIDLGPTISQCGGNVILDALNSGSTYQWNTGETTQQISVNKTGNYKLIINNGCGNYVDSVLVNVFTIPQVIIGGPFSVCDTTVTLTAGISALNKYAWFTVGDTTIISKQQSYIAKATGNYAVVVTNANGCSNMDTAKVSVNFSPIAVNLGGPYLQCGGSVTLDAGNAGSTYLWSTPKAETTKTISVSTLGKNNYSVTVSNACGTTTSTTSVEIIKAVKVNLGNDTTICNGSNLILDAKNVGATYLWNTTNAPITQTISVNKSGNYSVTVTQNGCSATDAINVTVINPISKVNLGTHAPKCGGSVILDAGVHQNVSYKWYDGAKVIAGATSQTFTAITTGNYSVVTTNSCGADTSSMANVIINAIPKVSLGGPYSQCGNILLSAGTQPVGTTFLWSKNGVAIVPSEIKASYLATNSGTYSVLVTSAAGCTAIDSATAKLATSKPSVTLPTSLSGCGGKVVLDAGNVGSIYQWSDGSTSQIINVASSGNYAVIVSNACGSDTSNISAITIFTTPAQPIITASGKTTFCTGDSVVFTSSSVAGGKYSWTPLSDTTQAITVKQNGSFTVTVTTALGCSATSLVKKVNVGATLTTPTISASGATSICVGDSVVLTSSYVSGNTWIPNNETTKSIVAKIAGNYSVTVTDTFGCVATSVPTLIKVNQLPNALITSKPNSATVCAGDTIKLTSSHVGGNLWSTGATSDSIVFVADTGTYKFSVVVTDANGCTIKQASNTFIYITGVDKPVITAVDSGAACEGFTILTSSASKGNTWFNLDTNQRITIKQSALAWVTVKNTNGCQKTSATKQVDVPIVTKITIMDSVSQYSSGKYNVSYSGAKDGSINLTITGGIAPYVYAWSGDTTAFSKDLNLLGAGIYIVKVSDNYGCEKTDTIKLIEPANSDLLPNGISPNGDGKNDTYIIGSIDKYPVNKFEVYNRWGSIVFNLEGYNNTDKIWRGTNNAGEDLPEGTYFVIISFPDGDTANKKTYVDLKR